MATQNSWNSQDPVQVSLGGTGLATLTAHSLQVGNGTGNITQLGVASNGQIPIGSAGADPALATITPGINISVTNGAGSITIAATGPGGITWVDQAGASVTMAVNTYYIADNAGLVTFTLPAVAPLGSMFAIVGKGAGGWTLVEATGQTIQFGTITTTVTTGSLSSLSRYDCVTLVTTTANTVFSVYASIGNITYV